MQTIIKQSLPLGLGISIANEYTVAPNPYTQLHLSDACGVKSIRYAVGIIRTV